eukprot:TRINITY_DN3114_c0_g1_i1.p1 TRINITY_DN3114_c0_g1~~TRINITY_DN3114_c0_g1_i1.p1  ORF type:complete len:523 (+),score=169.55 TRINITY_DN3114_c0_g1_i1:94-1662(+)
MVLAELGGRINAALSKLSKASTVDEAVIDEMLGEICRALLMADVNVRLAKQLRTGVKTAIAMEDDALQGNAKRRAVQNAVLAELRNLLDPGTKPFRPERGRNNVIMFVGLQGSGKTTTCTKYALYYQRKGWKVGLVCADTFRAGAFDQLKQNSMKANIRFYGSLVETDPVVIAREGVRKFKQEGTEIIIVDTSGRHKQEAALFDEMEQIAAGVEPDDVVFILDSAIGQAAEDQARAFKEKIRVGSIIITKLDGHAKGGGALSAVAATQSPICFVGTGEHFDDFEAFDAKAFLQRLLGMGDIQGLFEKIKDAGIDHKSELYQRFTEGVFTLRDMYEHLQNIMKLGPMGKVMEMIPGMPKGLLEATKGQDVGSRLKVYMCMMDSMTDKELDHGSVRKIMTPDRIARIARGAGRQPQDVSELLKAYGKFEEMVKKMGKVNFKQLAKDPSALTRGGANAPMSQLAKAVNPQVLKQLGGQQGLQNMMKSIAGGGGMPGGLGNLAGMMNAMGGGMPGMPGMGGGGGRR